MNAHAEPGGGGGTIRTTCPYCGVGCGVLATPDGRGGLHVAGDPAHPANFGRLCSKGSALGETVGLEGRLLHPMLRKASGGYERASWDDALDRVAEGLARIQRQHGPEALGFYVSGQLLTEDYYVANKLMKGYLGSANIDTNSRLCMASSVTGHRRAFGADTVPGCYADLDTADLIVLVGSNAAWCHPVLFQRMLRNRVERGARLVVVDPRRTATADEADLHLAIAPGMDALLFAGLLVHLVEQGTLDVGFIARHTSGFEEALRRVRTLAPDLAVVAAGTGLATEEIAAFYDLWARTPKVVTAWSQGVNQSAQGTDKVDAIINCHLAAGRIGRSGCGPFSLTGQPNAMGGREAGGLANMLAAHMGFAPAEVARVQRFWGAPNMAGREGLKAVAMMEAVAVARIRGLWVMATNPAVSLPRADRVRAALAGLDLFVVTEAVLSNDTLNAGAHVLLPAATWAEKDGTVTNSERRISRQRAALAAPGEAQPDWWIVCEVARRLGFEEGFSFDGPSAIFREHAALSAYENEGMRDFDIGGLANLSDAAYDALEPLQWPVRRGAAAARDDRRFFAEGGFFHPDRKARFIAVAPPALASATTPERPFVLNTGRVRDQWHTMTRSGRSPRLGQHRPMPFVEVSPADAARAGLSDGGFARLTSEHGSAVLIVRVSPELAEGALFAPFHWSAETASHGRVGALVQATVDPFSGQPEMKATPVAIEPVHFEATGFVLARGSLALPPDWWWAKVALEGATGYLVAAPQRGHGLVRQARALLAAPGIEFLDEAAGVYRAACLEGERLDAAVFLAPPGLAPGWEALVGLFGQPALSPGERSLLLSGRSADGLAPTGPIVCACFGVGLAAIVEAVTSGAATTVEALGRHLKAGTNCGSCLPELKRIVAKSTPEAMACGAAAAAQPA